LDLLRNVVQVSLELVLLRVEVFEFGTVLVRLLPQVLDLTHQG